jgi:hypothetical protein
MNIPEERINWQAMKSFAQKTDCQKAQRQSRSVIRDNERAKMDTIDSGSSR